MSGRGRTLGAVLLLLAASAVSASPTIISDGSIPVTSLSTDSATVIVSDVPGTIEFSSQISELSRTLLQPPQANNQTTQAGDNLYIPVLPPAVGMVLLGFMCVTLVRDRKTWVAALAGLLWVGQTGIWALPQLSSRISRKVNNSQPIEPALAKLYSLRDGFYPANYSEQIRYTGLLHHLAGIPKQTSVFTNNRTILFRHFYNASGKDTSVSQHAIIVSQFALSKPTGRLASGARQFICFTPAFIFACLPRGPPMPA